MNHHYQDNYHGYVRGTAGMQNMGYGHGVYEEQMPMGQMGPSRNSYQMPQYRDSGQMHPMMQHQQQSSMYPAAGYMNQMSSGAYGMGGYSANYGMPNQASMNTSSPMMMGPRGNMMGAYYNHSMNSQTGPRHPGATPNPNYNQSTSGGAMHGQSQVNHISNNQNCSQSQAGAMHGGQMSHCTSPHGMTATPPSTSFQGQGTTVSHAMMAGIPGQQRPVAANRSGSSMHAIPQHPMRHPATQQNPQEVADNILQIASSYPTNQTVQVPLKSRHAPYHVPRSPHYSMSSSDHGHSSPMASHSQQASPAPQPSPTPSTSSVKSPTPSLAPIPNPIPSPGITGLRSPCNQSAMACGAQRSPAHMASSYSGHGQPSPSPHHFSPTGMGNQQNFPSFIPSPTALRNVHTSSYPPAPDPNIIFPRSDNQDMNPSYSSPIPSSSSPHPLNLLPSDSSSSNLQFIHQGNKGNNPLMSLQKLVMLPETQVVDPKSVVNDACLSSQPNENEEVPKNGEDPAEGCAKSSDSSVGCSGQYSSHTLQSVEQTLLVENTQLDSVPKASNPDTSSTVAIEGSAPDVPADVGNAGNMLEAAVNISLQNIMKDPQPLESSCQDWKHSVMVLPSETNTGLDQETIDSKKDVDLTLDETHMDKINCVSELKDSTHDFPDSKEITEESTQESPNFPDITSEMNSQNEIHLSIADNAPAELQNDGVVHSLKRKNGKVNGLSEDVKNSLQCRSPGVLAEVPLLVNGLATSDSVGDSVDQDSDHEGNNGKLQNGFSARLRSKLRIGEKTGQFIRLTTPCSIAVGADERAMCERFVFRRNEYCRTLRTSRLLCNGRTRQDSTGNGDSDESIENVSDGSFHALGNPQDGCKKKASASSAKRSNEKNTAVKNGSQLVKKESLVSHKSQVHGASNGHVSNERTGEASDEDGEVCYYEGVDSSDFFLSTISSDDSISSSQEMKQTTPNSTSANSNHQNLASGTKKKELFQEEKTEDLNENISSPPPKRTRRSSGQKLQEPVIRKYSPSRYISHGSNNESDITCDTASKSDATKLDSYNQNSSQADCQENGKITRARVGKRKPPSVEAKEKQSANAQHKLPEVVVRLEKSPIAEKNPVKLEPVDRSFKTERIEPIVIDESSPEKCEEDKFVCVSKLERVPVPQEEDNQTVLDDLVKKESNIGNDNVIKSEMACSGVLSSSSFGPSKAPSKGTFTPRKKKVSKKGKKKKFTQGNRSKNDELKDSFKSMKFSRTLDMMKSQKKRESGSTGPFIRIEGSHNAPNTVSVFNQSSQDSFSNSNKQKNNNRQSHSRSVVSTIVHMVSNLSNDKTVMVSSTKCVPNQQWSCAFCFHHSSFQSLGDLFGPYFKEDDLPLIESIASEEGKKGDSSKDSPKPSNISPSKLAKGLPSDKKGSRKRKLSGKSEQHLPQEIWLHESCALWAPGVFLIGNRIYGLDDAIRDTAETICSVCRGKGAMIGCLFKGCAMKYHFSCAIEKDCYLDEGNFSLLCPKHKGKKFNMASSSSSSSAPKKS